MAVGTSDDEEDNLTTSIEPLDSHQMSTDRDPQYGCRYQRYHWAIWPRLLNLPWTENLVVEDEGSWRELLGRIGTELFRCFAFGDRNVRNDMALRAQRAGAKEIAWKLNRWSTALDAGPQGTPDIGNAGEPRSSNSGSPADLSEETPPLVHPNSMDWRDHRGPRTDSSNPI